MPELRKIDPELIAHPYFDPAIRDLVVRWPKLTFVDILIVVDPSIAVQPVGNGFGISRVIELLRDTKIGCMRFRVDIAQRGLGSPAINPSPSLTQPTYTNFRFNMTDGGDHVIDKYEQIWCFGFEPDNSGSLSDAAVDAPGNFPTTDPELEKLDEWMSEKKGGLFGTGDHHYIGASMCHKIPRLGTMRRWTNADGVPPQGKANDPLAHNRIDTLRPPSAAFEPGAPGGPAALRNTPEQGDLTIQPVQWVPENSVQLTLFKWKRRPHPVLCHPTLGPIDVMPDHAHEGLCVEDPDLNATKKFNSDPEYPDAINGGQKPAPKVIAFGSNLGDPPYNFQKGPQPARSRNPMIAVYDGHKAGVGRVATDSTWHHWMDVNIDNIAIADNNDWKKVKRYFQNLAVWLCPPGYTTRCMHLSVVTSHFEYVGFQEYYLKAPVRELGLALRDHLRLFYGPCWVTQYVLLVLRDFKLLKEELLPQFFEKMPDLELNGELLETLVLGHMAQATIEPAMKIKHGGTEIGKLKLEALPEPEKLFAEPVQAAVKEYFEICRKKCSNEMRALDELFG